MMGVGALLSALLHLAVLLLIFLGLPVFKKQPPEMLQPIPLQIAPVSDITQAPNPTPIPKPEEKAKPEEKKPEPVPEPKPAPRTEPLPEPEPVPLPEPEPVLPPVPEPAPEPKPEPKPEPVPEPKPKPEPKPEPKKPEPKKEKPKPKKDKPKPDKKKKDAADTLFEDMLKDLAEPQDTAPEEDKDALKKKGAKGATGVPSDTVTISEMDALRQHITRCWNLPAGAMNGRDLVVPVRVWMNMDGTVRDAKLVNPLSSSSNPFYRTAAESALRAVKDERCQPFPIPKHKYEQWKVFVIDFNPKDLL